MNQEIIIHRKELYEKVWQIPLTHIAKEYGVSDVTIKDICKKLNIPTPPVGYWQKLKYNKQIEKVSLPPISDDIKETYTTDPNATRPGTRKPVYTGDYKKIQVPAKLYNPHRLLEGIIHHDYTKEHVYLGVSDKIQQRALRIMDTLLKELEKRGCKIRNELRKNYIDYDHCTIRFSLIERTERTAIEKPEYSWEKYKFVSTGNLILKIDDWFYGESLRKRFADSEKVKVEDMLDDFIYYVFIGFSIEKDWKRKRAEEEQERKRIAQQKREEELRIEAEKAEIEKKRIEKENRVNQLVNFSLDYQKSQLIETFVNQVIALYSRNMNYEKQLHDWLLWVSQITKDINPLTSERFATYLLNFTFSLEEVANQNRE